MSDTGGGSPPYVSESDFSVLPNNSMDINDINEIIGVSQSQSVNNSTQNNMAQIKKPLFLYDTKHSGPFTVYVESSQKSGDNIGRLSALKIAREIFQLNLKNVRKINNKGINRISVDFLNRESANSFVQDETLIKKGYNLYIPSNLVTCKGLVRRIDLDENVEHFSLICKSNVEILHAQRLNRKVINDGKAEYVPTGTVLFTFKGTNLPQYVDFYNLPYPVNVYVPPVTQCYSCLLYGHTKKNCKSKPKCFNCADKKHEEQETEKFTCPTKCHFCRENHRSNSKTCPEYKRQQNIKKLMAFENLTYFDAERQCPKTYIQKGDYIYDPRNFPNLASKQYNNTTQKTTTNRQLITPSQRRTSEFNPTKPKRTYHQAVLTENNKKRIIQKGYDMNEHNEQLYRPNARPDKNSFTSYINDYQNHNNQPFSATNNSFQDTQAGSSKDESDFIKTLTANFINISTENQFKFKDFVIKYCQNHNYNDLDNPNHS